MVRRSGSLSKARASRAFLIILGLVVSACGRERAPASTPQEAKEPVVSRPAGFRDATDHYGTLIVREGNFEAESSTKPWSSWWYPVREKYLFEGKKPGDAPLEKYDRFSKKVFDRESKAAKYEKEKLYDPNAGSWEGLCNAWSAASLLAPEPTAPLTIHGITFEVGDLKALLVKTFEHVDGLKQFGQRFNGDRAGVFEDIYPEQFHRVLKSELFDRGRPLIIDKDPGIAVWNTPIWKAQFQLVRDGANPRVMHVTGWIFGASPFVESLDYVGTIPVVMQYTYDLYGENLPDGSLKVSHGEWTGDSLDYHPDFVSVLPEAPNHQSLNPEIQWEVVDAILAGK